MKIDFFTTTHDTVSHHPLLVTARVELLTKEAGGQGHPITKNYRPNHNFGGENDTHFFIGLIDLKQDEWMQPGETRELTVVFLNVRGLLEKLVPGTKWRMQEGPYLVALAEVLSVTEATEGHWNLK